MNIIGKPLGQIFDVVDDVNVAIGGITQGPLNKLWRLKILYNRRNSGKEQADQGNKPDPAASGLTTKSKRERREADIFENKTIRDRSVDSQVSVDITKPFNAENRLQQVKRDQIYIIPRDNAELTVTLQTIPKEVEVEGDANLAIIPSIGRNNPFYNYTGAEDTISFDITWYANEQNREDVISNCDKLKALTRADGYDKSIPLVYIKWSSKSTLFKDDTFILQSANYRLGLFHDSYMDKSSNTPVKLGLLPTLASQKLVFKKVSNINTKTNDLLWKSTP